MGCSNNTEKRAEYNLMKSAYQRINHNTSFSNFESVIELLVSPDIVMKDFVVANRDKLLEKIDINLYNNLLQNAQEENKDAPMDDFSNELENYVFSEEDIYDGDFPIYGSSFEIIGYGTREESEQSIIDFMNIPDNIIIAYSEYFDRITVRFRNKFTGEFMVKLRISENKIISFEIFR